MQEFIEDCLTLENFNSIKVRLELVFYCTPFDSMKNFNSIKVRLEPDSTSSYLTSLSFQFHKGAIRTLSPPAIAVCWRYFNSIKVRLEQDS